MLLGALKRLTAVSVGGYIAYNAFLVAAQDDWDSVRYQIKKLTLLKVIEKTLVPPSYRYPKKINKDRKKVVVLGSGWGAMSFLQQVDYDKVEVTIVSPRPYFFYTPLLTQTSTGTISHGSIKEPIRYLISEEGGGTYLQAEFVDVDVKGKKVACKDVSGNAIDVKYDELVVAVGTEVNTFNIEGVRENTIFMKELEDGIKVQRQILQNLEAANAAYLAGAPAEEVDRLLHWVVVGGGPTGVELSAEITDLVRDDMEKHFPHLAKRIRVTVVEGFDRLLLMFDKKLSEYAASVLKSQGVSIGCNTFVTKIADGYIHVSGKLDPIPMSSSSPSSRTDKRTTDEEIVTMYKLTPKWAERVKFEDFTIDKSGAKFSMKIPFGMAVWAGGNMPRQVTKDLMKQLGSSQSSRFGLEVDKKFRVKGVEDGSIFAIGDCAVSGDTPTAQAANQHGIYLGRLFRDTDLIQDDVNAYPDYKFNYKGSMAYVGGHKGIAQLKNVWNYTSNEKGEFTIEGVSAFTLWRSLYFSKLLSAKNRYQVIFEWVRTSLFGRDVAATDFQEAFVVDQDKDKGKKK